MAQKRQRDVFEEMAQKQAEHEPPCCSLRPRDWLPRASPYEPVPLKLNDLAWKHYGRKYDDLNTKDQVELIRNEITPKVTLIDGNSMFMRRWDIIMLLCLVFVAIVTPYEVSFLETTGINFLWVFNRVVDCFFIVDIVMNFYVKVKVVDKSGASRVLRTRVEITKNYLRTWFWIDFTSVLPFDVIGLIYADTPGMQQLKVIKVIRLLRLLKLIRVLRASRMIARWENHISLSYSKQSLVKFLITLLFCSHILACFWGLLGRYSIKLTCSDDYKLVSYDVGEGYISTSWIIQLHEAKDSPDDPCDPFTVYLWSLHWSVMSITSIGYGDISPTRDVEYFYCVFGMLSGGILWAYIIGSVCGVVSNMDPHETAFRQVYDNLNFMMEDQKITQKLRLRIREYFRECQHMTRVRSYRDLQDKMSGPLRGEVALQTYYVCIKNVSFFHTCCRDFLIEVSLALEGEVFAPREFFPQFGRLWVISRGAACREGVVFVPGHVFGEDMIVDCLELQNHSTALAMTYCEVQCLTKDKLTLILTDYPVETKIVRKAAIRMAVQRGVRIYCQNARARKQRQSMQGLGSLGAEAAREKALKNGDGNANMPMPLQSDEEITRNYRQAGRKYKDSSLYNVTLSGAADSGDVDLYHKRSIIGTQHQGQYIPHPSEDDLPDKSLIRGLRNEIKKELNGHLDEVRRVLDLHLQSFGGPRFRPAEKPGHDAKQVAHSSHIKPVAVGPPGERSEGACCSTEVEGSATSHR